MIYRKRSIGGYLKIFNDLNFDADDKIINMTILVTGAAGFIGSNFVLDWLNQSKEDVVSLDLLTYAGNLENLSSLDNNPRHHFIKGNIGDRELVSELLKKYQVRAVVNFAAESHVDRSIH